MKSIQTKDCKMVSGGATAAEYALIASLIKLSNIAAAPIPTGSVGGGFTSLPTKL